jgi:uncharacterized membrane protein YtjA (UPF0391 family)
MWRYAAVLLGIAVIAEAVGLGGVPAPAVEIENVLFIVLLLVLIARMLGRFARRPGLPDSEYNGRKHA